MFAWLTRREENAAGVAVDSTSLLSASSSSTAATVKRQQQHRGAEDSRWWWGVDYRSHEDDLADEVDDALPSTSGEIEPAVDHDLPPELLLAGDETAEERSGLWRRGGRVGGIGLFGVMATVATLCVAALDGNNTSSFSNDVSGGGGLTALRDLASASRGGVGGAAAGGVGGGGFGGGGGGDGGGLGNGADWLLGRRFDEDDRRLFRDDDGRPRRMRGASPASSHLARLGDAAPPRGPKEERLPGIYYADWDDVDLGSRDGDGGGDGAGGGGDGERGRQRESASGRVEREEDVGERGGYTQEEDDGGVRGGYTTGKQSEEEEEVYDDDDDDDDAGAPGGGGGGRGSPGVDDASGGVRPGIPKLVKHIRYADESSGGARVVLVLKPGEWGLCYLQLASIRRWAPKVLPHVTVLTYDDKSHRACSTQRGVDCFFDEDFVSTYGGAGAGGGERASLYDEALSWRKVHAALSLLDADIPVVLLDADTVFLRDPSAAWRAALARYDVVCTADVGDEGDAQRNMNTKLVILPAGAKSRELVRAWLAGEAKFVEGINLGESPEQSYFNYVLVPTMAGHFRIHALSAREASNFVTLDRGDDGAFGSTLMVTAGYCGGHEGKEAFLQHVLEEKDRAEEALSAEPGADEAREMVRDVELAELGSRRGNSGSKHSSSSSSSSSSSKEDVIAERREARIAKRKRERAAARIGALPRISSVEPASAAAAAEAAGSRGGGGGAGGVAFSRQLRCDHDKRELVFQGRYRVTEDRHIVWN